MKKYRIFLWLSGLEAFVAGIYLALIPGDPKNSVLLGLSLVRLVNIGVFVAIGIGLVVSGVWLHRLAWLSDWLKKRSSSLLNWQKTLWFLSSLLLVIWLFPVYRVKDFDLIWERLLPSIVLGIGFILTMIALMVAEGVGKGYFQPEGLKPGKRLVRIWLILMAATGVVVIIVGLTGFGVIPPMNRFWNTAGVPVLFEQVLYLVLGYVFLTGLKSIYFPDRKWRLDPRIVFLLLWIVAFGVWDAQPIANSHFVYQPEFPNYEHYPLSDARRFDLGAQFMLAGQGIFDGNSEEKPFMMAYLAFLHVIAGSNYIDMVRVQVIILSLIVPFMYLIGRRLYSEEFGLALAVIGMLYEVNTVNSSVFINSAHVKLLLSEPLSLLGVVVATYTLIRWMEGPGEVAWGVITLGLIGFFTYMRANVLFLYPAAFGMILWAAYPKIKKGIRVFLQANIGFAGVLLPWMVYAYLKYGYITLFNKFEFVIKHRLLNVWNNQLPVAGKLAVQSFGAGGMTTAAGIAILDSVHFQAAHFMNNLIKSLLVFPTSLKLEKIRTVLDQQYWNEQITWDGSVGVLFYANLGIILLGIVCLIASKKAIGAAPLVIGMMYNLASSIATTSGGRYLKPSIWVFILYYLAGLYFLLDRVIIAARLSPVSITGKLDEPASRTSRQKKEKTGLWIAVSFLLVVSFVIPAADAAIPARYPEMNKQEVLMLLPGDVVAGLGMTPGELAQLVADKELRVYYGDGLYPRQVVVPDGLDYFGFSVVGRFPAVDARFFGSWDGFEHFPNNSVVVALGCRRQVEKVTYHGVALIYLPEYDVAFFSGSDWQAICPGNP
jgi:hypothetical protein